MNLVYWINAKIKIFNKKDFKYECTFAWATIAFLSFLLLIFIVALGWHFNAYFPEFTKEYLPQMVDSYASDDSLYLRKRKIVIVDISLVILLYVYSLTDADIKTWREKYSKKAEKICSFIFYPVIWIGGKTESFINLVLSKFCKQIPRD